MNLTKKLWIANILIVGLLMTSLPAGAQKPPSGAPTNKTIVEKKQPIRTVSGGVVNGRALELVRPEYPKAAASLRVRGIVKISVWIDENGKVIKTRVLSGHPLLVASARRAATASTFTPVNIGGLPVRVFGHIQYYFHNNELNWLEIGYATQRPYFNERDNLGSFLPTEFESQKQLWEQYLNDETERRDEILASFALAVEARLANDAKSLWLYRLGRALGSAPFGINKYDEYLVARLNDLLDSAPGGVSPILKTSVRKLIDAQSDRAEFYRQNSALVERLYGFGK